MTVFAQSSNDEFLYGLESDGYFKSPRHRDAWVEEYKVREAIKRVNMANAFLLTVRRMDKNQFMERFKCVAVRSIDWYLMNEHKGFMDIKAMLIAATLHRAIAMAPECTVISVTNLLSALHTNVRVAMETTAAHDWINAFNVRAFVYDVYKDLANEYPNPKNPLVFNNYTLHDALKVFSLWAAVEMGNENRYVLPSIASEGFLFHYKMYEEYRKDYEETLERWREK